MNGADPHRILACTRSSPHSRPPRATPQHRATAGQKRMRRQYSWISLCHAMPASIKAFSTTTQSMLRCPRRSEEEEPLPRIAQETRHKKETGGRVYNTRARRSAVPLSRCASSHAALSRTFILPQSQNRMALNFIKTLPALDHRPVPSLSTSARSMPRDQRAMHQNRTIPLAPY